MHSIRTDTDHSDQSPKLDQSVISKKSVLQLMENNETMSGRYDIKGDMSAKFSGKFDYSYE